MFDEISSEADSANVMNMSQEVSGNSSRDLYLMVSEDEDDDSSDVIADYDDNEEDSMQSGDN